MDNQFVINEKSNAASVVFNGVFFEFSFRQNTNIKRLEFWIGEFMEECERDFDSIRASYGNIWNYDQFRRFVKSI
jgi:hypothetical protein